MVVEEAFEPINTGDRSHLPIRFQMQPIPVIDLFAGPGGLSHGFFSFRSRDLKFRPKLSIEKDVIAHRTLVLRAFLRQFRRPPTEYYRYIRGEKRDRTLLEEKYPEQWKVAHKEARHWELGATEFAIVHREIKKALSGAAHWVLLGGPPCQAYSLAGRARMKHHRKFSADARHTLYREYLKIVAVHQPAVFVMENVKGILSSTHGARNSDESIFQQLLDDLREPASAVKCEKDAARYLPRRNYTYRIYSFVTEAPLGWGPEVFRRLHATLHHRPARPCDSPRLLPLRPEHGAGGRRGEELDQRLCRRRVLRAHADAGMEDGVVLQLGRQGS